MRKDGRENINETVDRRVSESRIALMLLYRENSDLEKGKIISERKRRVLLRDHISVARDDAKKAGLDKQVKGKVDFHSKFFELIF